MNQDLAQRLLALNRSFYADFAGAFSETRSSAQPSLDKIVTYIAAGVKVLDVGCGNGRLAQRLEQAAISVTYVGLDCARALIEIAAGRAARLQHVQARLYVADITQPGWQDALEPPFQPPFDVIAALAVLHHIPGFELRRQVLSNLGALLRHGGTLVMTNWQFTAHARLRKKIAPWQAVGIDEREVEPGDALLDWKRGGRGYRYCHLLTVAEVEQLAAASGLQVSEQFCADGGLNLYSILTASAG